MTPVGSVQLLGSLPNREITWKKSAIHKVFFSFPSARSFQELTFSINFPIYACTTQLGPAYVVPAPQ
jgi:hypothetical protein